MEDEVDELVVKLIVKDGHQIKAAGLTREAAIREMNKAGIDHHTMAARLGITPKYVVKLASKIKERLKHRQPPHWTADYLKTHRNSKEYSDKSIL